jgi:hypothetical protein
MPTLAWACSTDWARHAYAKSVSMVPTELRWSQYYGVLLGSLKVVTAVRRACGQSVAGIPPASGKIVFSRGDSENVLYQTWRRWYDRSVGGICLKQKVLSGMIKRVPRGKDLGKHR